MHVPFFLDFQFKEVAKNFILSSIHIQNLRKKINHLIILYILNTVSGKEKWKWSESKGVAPHRCSLSKSMHRVGETAFSKVPPCQHRDLSLDLQNSHQKTGCDAASIIPAMTRHQ